MSYFGCSPANRAKLLATLSPREDVRPGCSTRALDPPLPALRGGLEGRRDKRLGFVSLLLYALRANSSQLFRSTDLICPGRTAPGALP